VHARLLAKGSTSAKGIEQGLRLLLLLLLLLLVLLLDEQVLHLLL
jgi:hypothetical protein